MRSSFAKVFRAAMPALLSWVAICAQGIGADLYSPLPLGAYERSAVDKMKASAGYGIARAEFVGAVSEPKPQVVLLEAGYHAWGGYDGSLWMKSQDRCRLLIVRDKGESDPNKMLTKEMDLECLWFDALWSKLMSASALTVKTVQQESTKPHGAKEEVFDGGTYFLTIYSTDGSNTFAAYEPCRLERTQQSSKQCAVMRSVRDATVAATGVEIGPGYDQ